ncbi:Farnesyl diphosphate synthase [Defluviimonas aquaemixtae]|uniref:Geranylgeranyl diphosphate synthase n=1 Tax=Albidovulum aquaemixtae TaxID=1542388 RepID=A0A2R8BJR3_9RHOB|nr:farnesyl diphosphate synthase [Defluviimonas aquaemixtae]SPH23636.1 Farnesyl diphosphate synthase [Defluviimonas aquaemixtae]
MFPDRLKTAQDGVQAALDAALAARAEVAVIHAMRYALKGGKRLRAFLVLEGAALHGLAAKTAMPAAAAVEALHAYSLIHDDLPCMDDDDLRRGRPTVHVEWDEATAVLAGDALQTLAFELCTDPVLGPADRRIELVRSLALASGAEGMVLGQALDIAAESAPRALTLDEITALQAGKTGALIAFAATAGAVLSNADRAPLAAYARALGLAFQITDDILDVEGDPEKAGKRLKKDIAAGKATFVSLLGIDAAKARARELVAEAEEALASFGSAAEPLRQVARFVIEREA